MNSSTRFLLAIAVLSSFNAIGCVQTGGRSSIWPTLGGQSSSPGIGKSIASTATGVKGQISSMGTAVSSAYGKAKTSITSAFTGNPTTPTDDPTSLSSRPTTIGPEIYVAQGQLYETTGQYTKAFDNYSKALEAEPKNLPALLSVARLHERQNESAKACEFFQKAIDIKGNDAAIYVELGNSQKHLGQLDKAKASYMAAINLQPTERSHRAAMASVLLEEGRDQEALHELAQTDPPAMANYQLAYLYMTRQNVPQAQQHLAAALQIDPNLQPARDLMNQLGGSQVAQGAYGAYQTAGNVMQSIQGLTGAMPSGPIQSGGPVQASGTMQAVTR